MIIEIIKSILLGIVQGITEWLPISSTGHLIIFESFLQMNFQKEFIDTFFVVIQLGSILAVIILFFNKINPFQKNKEEVKNKISLWLKIIIASIPVAICGFLFEDKIDELLYNPFVVAVMLILFGIVILLVEKYKQKFVIEDIKDITFKVAFFIGVFQVLALIPGTSRSGATIVGALILGLSRKSASEFSFILAIPALLGAGILKLLKMGLAFSLTEWIILIIGLVTAFIVSILVIKLILNYIKKHDFKVFGYYRIILGIIILLFFIS
ncbi:MAG: undecaprenyl-diphosphate phosphatase [Mollicutes bacterium]|nr:undecaprenyl-diphosphate phosphatase [Mollicutes bacterium]